MINIILGKIYLNPRHLIYTAVGSAEYSQYAVKLIPCKDHQRKHDVTKHNKKIKKNVHNQIMKRPLLITKSFKLCHARHMKKKIQRRSFFMIEKIQMAFLQA